MMRILALVTDAFGAGGGISQYNRDFLSALARCKLVESITVLPRLADHAVGLLPRKICQLPPSARRLSYTARALRLSVGRKFDVVFCGHLFMVPLAALIARQQSAKLWLQLHGIEAWDTPSWPVRRASHAATLVTCVSRYTRSRVLTGWLDIEPWKVRVLPNTVGEVFTPGQAPRALRDRYGLGDRKVILTVSRISLADRYKGHDRVIRALPEIIKRGIDVIYLIAGDGDGIPRLRHLAQEFGLQDRVVFAGHVPSAELVDHFRLADAFVMPSTKEGFGIVFLEAAASGLPVIGGNRDGSLDALADGAIGRAVDPDSREELVAALTQALTGRAPRQSEAVRRFSFSNFAEHVDQLVRILGR